MPAEERCAPYQPAGDEWAESLEAERVALDALLRYQPTSLSEVKALATYLLTTDELGQMAAGAETATLLRTLAAIAA